jgi:hypothetical protein
VFVFEVRIQEEITGKTTRARMETCNIDKDTKIEERSWRAEGQRPKQEVKW